MLDRLGNNETPAARRAGERDAQGLAPSFSREIPFNEDDIHHHLYRIDRG
jgi:hypothetical protein